MSLLRNRAAAIAAAMSVLVPSTVLAQVSGDGWRGPRTFGDAALNESLLAINDLLQARYVNDDMIASLGAGPHQNDFVTVASAVSDVPELTSMQVDHGSSDRARLVAAIASGHDPTP